MGPRVRHSCVRTAVSFAHKKMRTQGSLPARARGGVAAASRSSGARAFERRARVRTRVGASGVRSLRARAHRTLKEWTVVSVPSLDREKKRRAGARPSARATADGERRVEGSARERVGGKGRARARAHLSRRGSGGVLRRVAAPLELPHASRRGARLFFRRTAARCALIPPAGGPAREPSGPSRAREPTDDAAVRPRGRSPRLARGPVPRRINPPGVEMREGAATARDACVTSPAPPRPSPTDDDALLGILGGAGRPPSGGSTSRERRVVRRRARVHSPARRAERGASQATIPPRPPPSGGGLGGTKIKFNSSR